MTAKWWSSCTSATARRSRRSAGSKSSRSAGERPAPIEFSLSGLELGTHQGFVRIVGERRAALRRCALLHGRRAAAEQGAAAGRERRRHAVPARGTGADCGSRAAAIEVCLRSRHSSANSTSLPLADFAAVCLVDPPPLPDAAWQVAGRFCRRGRRRRNFSGPPCAARRNERARGAAAAAGETALAIARGDVPAAGGGRASGAGRAARAGRRGAVVGVSGVQVLGAGSGREAGARRRVVRQRQAGARGAADRRGPRADDDDAGFRSGVRRSVEPVADGPDPWPFLALANGIVEYLAGAGDTQLNYLAGQTVVLPLSPEEQVSSYVLQMPDAQRACGNRSRRASRICRSRRPRRWATTACGPAATGAARSRLQRESAGRDQPAGARAGRGDRRGTGQGADARRPHARGDRSPRGPGARRPRAVSRADPGGGAGAGGGAVVGESVLRRRCRESSGTEFDQRLRSSSRAESSLDLDRSGDRPAREPKSPHVRSISRLRIHDRLDFAFNPLSVGRW